MISFDFIWWPFDQSCEIIHYEACFAILGGVNGLRTLEFAVSGI